MNIPRLFHSGIEPTNKTEICVSHQLPKITQSSRGKNHLNQAECLTDRPSKDLFDDCHQLRPLSVTPRFYQIWEEDFLF